MINWDLATYEALQEDAAPRTALPSEQFQERLNALSNENEMLREDLEQVRAMFRAEDKGWLLISGMVTKEKTDGFSLEDIQHISDTIRPHVVGDGLPKRGVDLHSGYVWSKGMNIEGVERETADTKPKRGRPSKKKDLTAFVNDPVNQDSLFSDMAHQEIQKARYADGNLILACNTKDGTVRRIPLREITDIRVNPDFPEEVWMYQRTWHPESGPTAKPRKRWYYTNRYTENKQKSITENGHTVPVDQDVTIVDRRFNRQVGYALGIPDAVAMMVWAAAYEEILQYGRIVNESLAKLVFKVVSKTKSGQAAAGVKFSAAGSYGAAANMLEGQDVQVFSSAGKGYEFSNARPIGAMAAMSINVPNTELLADSSAAGSSYGAAETLTPSTKNAMRLMQAEWVSMFQEVLDLFGYGKPRVWFEPLEDVDIYRVSQALALNGSHLHDEEIRAKALDIMDIAGDPDDLPDKVTVANDMAQAGLEGAQNAAKQAAAPDQGKSNGTGSGGKGANDQRSDTISKKESLMREFANEEFLQRFESLVTRLEAASSQ